MNKIDKSTRSTFDKKSLNFIKRRYLFIISMLFMLIFATACVDKSSTGNKSSDSVINEKSSVDVQIAAESAEPKETEKSEQLKESDILSKTQESVISFDLSTVPEYSGDPHVDINDGKPFFTSDELAKAVASYETYSEIDSLGRCGVCIGSIGQDIMPTEKRGTIGSVKPSGWNLIKYDFIDGNYLYNRCHLIGYQLSGENANTKNLITGTRYLNVEGMLPFENIVADYVEKTNKHVLYRVTPAFEGDNLVADGVLMEAESVEDIGESVLFCAYVYNVQPGVDINYKDGTSNSNGLITKETLAITSTQSPTETQSPAITEEPSSSVSDDVMVWIPKTGSKYHNNPSCSNMKDPSQVTMSEAVSRGYDACKKCY